MLVERHHARGYSVAGSASAMLPAEGAAVADRRMRDVLRRLGEERDMPLRFPRFSPQNA
jgi:hypothetical protein